MGNDSGLRTARVQQSTTWLDDEHVAAKVQGPSPSLPDLAVLSTLASSRSSKLPWYDKLRDLRVSYSCDVALQCLLCSPVLCRSLLGSSQQSSLHLPMASIPRSVGAPAAARW